MAKFTVSKAAEAGDCYRMPPVTISADLLAAAVTTCATGRSTAKIRQAPEQKM